MSASIHEALRAGSAVPFAAGVVVMVAGLLGIPASGRTAPAELAASLSLGLEFLLAAGMLRLPTVGSFLGLAVVAAIVLLRRLLGTGLRLSLRALGAGAAQVHARG